MLSSWHCCPLPCFSMEVSMVLSCSCGAEGAIWCWSWTWVSCVQGIFSSLSYLFSPDLIFPPLIALSLSFSLYKLIHWACSFYLWSLEQPGMCQWLVLPLCLVWSLQICMGILLVWFVSVWGHVALWGISFVSSGSDPIGLGWEIVITLNFIITRHLKSMDWGLMCALNFDKHSPGQKELVFISIWHRSPPLSSFAVTWGL